MNRADAAPPAVETGAGLWIRSMPLVFVFFWSTGFLAAKAGLPHVEPLTFLLLRFVLVVALMLPIALLWRAPWPVDGRQAARIGVAGVLMQGGYLVGVFAAIYAGMSAGLVALIVGLQPILTAFVAAPLLRERVVARQWLGLALGLAGVALVLGQRLGFGGLSPYGFFMAIVALLSITAGTVYQKRFCGHFDVRTGSVIQFVAAGLVLLPFALLFETMRIDWTMELVLAMAWLVIVLSIVSTSLLIVLIRRGAATRVVSLFYLVPPATALEAYLMFGERLSMTAMFGMGLAFVGVALVVART